MLAHEIRRPAGFGELAFDRVGERSVVTKALAASPLRLVTTRARADVAWVVTTTLGGGLVDGDVIDLRVTVSGGARALVSTQSSTKAYKSRRGARQRARAEIRDASAIAIANDPLVPFEGAEHASELDVELAPGASAILVDAFTAGRSARGERWAFRSLSSRVRVARAGRAIVDERVVLDPAHGDVAARMGRFDVIASAAIVGPAFATSIGELVASVSGAKIRRNAPTIEVASRLADDAVLLRVASDDVETAFETLRARLASTFAIFGVDPWARRPG